MLINNWKYRPSYPSRSQEVRCPSEPQPLLAAALLLDLSAAFDIVDHEILMKKLDVYNFSQDSIKWFLSYLGNRIQTVQVESKFSDPEPLGNYGVPQGSVLGPLFFIIFNNDFAASGLEGTSMLMMILSLPVIVNLMNLRIKYRGRLIGLLHGFQIIRWSAQDQKQSL